MCSDMTIHFDPRKQSIMGNRLGGSSKSSKKFLKVINQY